MFIPPASVQQTETNNAAGSGKAGMDALTVAAFEQRAAEAEARLSVLEAKLLAGASTGAVGSGDELLALRELLVKAREATVKLQAERDAAVSENMKLKYQIKHLKRAVVEGDEKLAQLGNGGL